MHAQLPSAPSLNLLGGVTSALGAQFAFRSLSEGLALCAATLGILTGSMWIATAWHSLRLASHLSDAIAQAAFLTAPNLTAREVKAISERQMLRKGPALRRNAIGGLTTLASAVALTVLVLTSGALQG